MRIQIADHRFGGTFADDDGRSEAFPTNADLSLTSHPIQPVLSQFRVD